MRTIKFRAWDKKKKEMIFNPIINDIDSATNYIGLNSLFEKFSERGFILMQFTGLKDKNGKEIYPNDIIKIENDNLIVYFDEGTLIYCLKNKYGIHMGSLIGNGKIEVIGNIHDNPELIK